MSGSAGGTALTLSAPVAKQQEVITRLLLADRPPAHATYIHVCHGGWGEREGIEQRGRERIWKRRENERGEREMIEEGGVDWREEMEETRERREERDDRRGGE